MSYPSWQDSRQQFSYQRRRPEASVMYQVVYNFREDFETHYDDLFQHKYGTLRPEILKTFDKYLNCGILRHGCARARCENCNHSLLIPFSCKARAVCNSCQAKRAVLFAENLHENILLPFSHRHVVFSLPKRLRIFFRLNRDLFKPLFRAAWESWTEYVTEYLPEGKSGAVMSLHTSGSILGWHPHIHAIALNGVILEDGTFQLLPDVDNDILQDIFTNKVLKFLSKLELITEDAIDSINTQEHTGFNVYAAEPVDGDDENARLFLSRYLKKPTLAENRISIEDNGLMQTVRCTNILDDGEEEVKDFSPLEFLAELSSHVPRPYEQTTRFTGIYSCRGRVRIETNEDESLAENEIPGIGVGEGEEPKPLASYYWARCMRLVFEIDPLACPRCGGEMKIIAFLHNAKEIEKIAENLGEITWRAPPDLRKGQDGMRLDTSDEYSQI